MTDRSRLKKKQKTGNERRGNAKASQQARQNLKNTAKKIEEKITQSSAKTQGSSSYGGSNAPARRGGSNSTQTPSASTSINRRNERQTQYYGGISKGGKVKSTAERMKELTEARELQRDNIRRGNKNAAPHRMDSNVQNSLRDRLKQSQQPDIIKAAAQQQVGGYEKFIGNMTRGEATGKSGAMNRKLGGSSNTRRNDRLKPGQVVGKRPDNTETIKNIQKQRQKSADEISQRGSKNIQESSKAIEDIKERNLAGAITYDENGNPVVDKKKKRAGDFKNWMLDLEVAGLQMGGDALVGIGTGGLGGMASMFTRAGGMAMDEAERAGASRDQAIKYGLAIGGVEALTEKIGAVASPLRKVYGKGVTDTLMEKIIGKMTAKTTAGEIGQRTFMSALSEGLEEMVAEGVEPEVANKIYADTVASTRSDEVYNDAISKGYSEKEARKFASEAYNAIHQSTSLADIFRAGSIGAAMGGILGGAGNVIEAGQGAAIKDLYGKDGIREMAKKAKDSDDDTVVARATAILDQIDNGGDVTAGQANAVFNAVQQQEAKDDETMRRYDAGIYAEMRRNGYESPLVEDEEGNAVGLNRVASEKYEALAGEALEAANEVIESEEESGAIADAIAAVMTGIASPQQVSMFTTSNPQARAVFESVTGETLPKSNAQMREKLFAMSARNYVETAAEETDYLRDQIRGVLGADMTVDYGSKGQAELTKVLDDETIDPRDPAQAVAVSAFEDYYRAGALGIPMEQILQNGNPQHNTLSMQQRKAAYEAGIRDAQASRSIPEGSIIAMGERIANQKNGAPKGILIDDTKMLRGSERKMYQRLAQNLHINIHVVDHLPGNGKYENGEVYLAMDNESGGLFFVFAHEITHHIKAVSPDSYKRLEKLVKERWEERGGIDEEIKRKTDLYEKAKQKAIAEAEAEGKTLTGAELRGYELDRDDALEEIIADATYEMFGDPEFVKKICAEDRTFGQTILYAIRQVLAQIRMALASGDGYTPYHNAELLSQLDILSEFEDLWLQGLRDAARAEADFRSQTVAIEATEEDVENSDSINDFKRLSLREEQMDQELVEQLNAENKVKVYRAMQYIDGKLYPPMAAVVEGDLNGGTELNKWEQSEERPDLGVWRLKGKTVDKDTPGAKLYFKLDKGNGTSLYARYNPYIHTSLSPLNDQFSSAYKRPNMVVVEGEIPESELTSKYKADLAKDSVGETEWKSGKVASELKKKGKPRRVILSRYFRPTRVLEDSEAAKEIAAIMEGTDISIPAKVVTPGLREALENEDVAIDYDGFPQEVKARFSVRDQEYMDAVERGDMETAQQMVDEAAKEAGYNSPILYHGTPLKMQSASRSTLSDEEYAELGEQYDDKLFPFVRFNTSTNWSKLTYTATNKRAAENFAYPRPGTVLGLYARMQNPLTVNEHVYDSVPMYDNVPTPSVMKEAGITKETLGTEEVAHWAKDNGYDGVIIEGIREGGGIYTDDYIVFSSNQLKSADPVTYDDNGDVVPLSERFNQENADIRYSVRDQNKRDAGEKLTEAQFYRLYSAHKLDLRKNGNIEEQVESIKKNGFRGDAGFGNNVVPSSINNIGRYTEAERRELLSEYLSPEQVDESIRRQREKPEPGFWSEDTYFPEANATQRRYGGRKGDTVLLVPEGSLDVTKYTESVKNGFKPFDYEVVKVERDFQPYYELYSKAYDEYQEKRQTKLDELNEKYPDVRFSIPDRTFDTGFNNEGMELTEGQKKYFKDSKAVDDEGNLVVVYHSTDNGGFTVFDPSMSDDGLSLFFTSNLTMSQSYSRYGGGTTYFNPEDEDFEWDEEGITYPCYLNLRDPLVIDCRDANWDNIIDEGFNNYAIERWEDYESGEPVYRVSEVGGEGYSSLLDDGLSFDDLKRLYGDSLANAVKDRFGEEENADDQFWTLEGEYYDPEEEGYPMSGTTRDWAMDAKDGGFDGVIFKNLMDNGGKSGYGWGLTGDVYVAFNSNQVKDVRNENPTEDADIRFSVKEVEDNIRETEGKNAPIGVSVNNDGNVKYSIPTEYNNHLKGDGRIASVRAIRDDWMKGRPKERKALNEVLDQISDFMVGANDLYEYVSLDNVQSAKVAYRTDENGNPTSVILSCQVANGEYEVNFDFTTICKKRESFQKVIEDLYREGVDELDLTEENIFAINQELKKYGYETACPICFVEARRYMNKEYARKIVDTWNEAVEKINPNAEYFDFENADIESFDYPAIDKAFKAANIGSESFEEKVAKLVASGEVFQKKLKQSDVLTNKGVQGLKAMSNKKNSLFGYLKQSRGAAAPKEAVAFVAYNGEFETLPETMKKMPLADYLASIAGARLQSFSDFQIENTFDYMQLIAGMAARRVPTHTYSKEPAFVRIFGMTGMKINMSIVCDIDPNVPEEYAGMTYDDNGNLVYNFGEQSFPMEEARELQADKRYSKNVGTILVGLSDYHIGQALNDKDIRFIIPYHSSGLPSQIMDETKLEMAKDYTKFQNTCTLSESGIKALEKAGYETDIAKVFKEKGRKGALKYYLDAFDKIGLKDSYVKKSAAGYGDFDLYGNINETKNPRTTADNYIEWCLENGNFPLFFQFARHKNYYKVLYDFDPYDSVTERYAPQKAVQNIYPGMDITKGQTDTTELESIITEYLEERNEIGKERNNNYADVMTEIKANIFGLKSEAKYSIKETDSNGIRYSVPTEPTPIPNEEDAIDYANGDPALAEFAYDSSPYAQAGKAVREKSYDELKAKVERLQADKRLTHGRVLDTTSIREDVENMLRTMASIAEQAGNPVLGLEGKMNKANARLVNDIIKNSKHIYKMMKSGREEEAVIAAMNVADDIVERIQVIDDAEYDTYKKMKKYLRETPITISEEDASSISDFGTFKKNLFGKVRIVKEGGLPVDSVYEELMEMFPGVFDEEVTHPADQLMAIVDARESFEPYDVMLTAEEREQLLKDTTMELLDIIADGEPWRSWADKKSEMYQNKVKMLQERHREALRDRTEKERARAERLVQAEKTKAKEKKEKAKDKKERLKAFGSIEKNHKWLSDRLLKPTDDKHIPEDYKIAVADLLMTLDLQTERSKALEEKTGRVAQKTFKFRELLDAYEEIANPEGTGILEYDDTIVSMLKDSLAIKLDGKSVDALDTATMREVDTLLKAIVGNIKNVNKAFAAERDQTIDEMAAQVTADCNHIIDKRGTFSERKKNLKRYFLETSKVINIGMKKPREFFTHLGKGMTDAYMEIRHGEDKHFRNMQVLRERFEEIFKQYNNKKKPGSAIEKWRDTSTLQTFELENGESVKLNIAQVMSLYCLSKREQALGHIYGSGIVPSKVEGISGKIIHKKNEVEGSKVMVTYGDVMKIIDSLTDEQRTMADQLQELLNNEVAAWGNETSMLLYNYEKFTEKNYFPIKSDDAYLDSSFEGRTAEERIRNFGFTKGTITNANNPIVIADIFEVVTDHCNKMSLYNSFAAPLADFTRLYNSKFRNEDGTLNSSVKDMITKAYGKDTHEYIQNFMADVNNNTQVRPDETRAVVNKFLANYKRATIGMNMRVAVQQPTAIVRAFDVIDPKYFVADKQMVAPWRIKRDIKEMCDHCPIALWKSWGHNDVDMARDLDDIMMNKAWSRFDIVTMGTYGALDIWTWSKIWNAVKREVKAKNPGVEVGSDEYWDLCNERASEVFDRTQVVDSVLHRSQTMRSKDTMTKMISSFMAEPTTTFNMLQSDIAEARDLIMEGEKGKAAKKLTRCMTVFGLNAAAVSAAAAVIDLLRGKEPDDDDKDKEGFELWYANFLNNFIDNANPIKMIPYPSTAFELFEGTFGTSNMAFEGWESLAKGLKEFQKYLRGDSKKSEFEVMWMVGDGIGNVLGIPIKSVDKDYHALMNRLGISFASEKGSDEKVRVTGDDGTIFEFYPDENMSLTEKFFKMIGVDDNSKIDKFLNKFGINLSEEEKQEQEYQNRKDEILKKCEGLEGEEREKKLWSIITGKKDEENLGITSYIESADFDKVEEMKKLYVACGGDKATFDEKVIKKAKTAYKKTIGIDDAMERQFDTYDFLIRNGVSEAEISEIVKSSDTAREFKKAYALGDDTAAALKLSYLTDAGLNYEDYEYLCSVASRSVKASDYATGEFEWPTNGTVTSGFGHRSSPGGIGSTNHQGMDIGAPTGNPVTAADGGKVISAGWNGGYGNCVIIDHGNGYKTLYGHLSGYEVKQGQIVKKDQQIGKVGSTGNSTGPHLHFGVMENDHYVNPANYLQR